MYIGHGHHSHRQKTSKWASPFIVGQHGTVEDCLIKYTDYISTSELAEEMEELIGKRLLSDTPDNMPCTADVLIAMVYYSWRNNSLVIPQEYTKPRKKANLHPNKWSRRALGLMAATTGDAWRAIHGEWGSMARHPPLPLAQYHRWQQQSLTDTFASHFPDEVFDTFSFPYIEDLVNLPAFNRYAAWVEGRGTPPGCPSPPSYASKTTTKAAGKVCLSMCAGSAESATPAHKSPLPQSCTTVTGQSRSDP